MFGLFWVVIIDTPIQHPTPPDWFPPSIRPPMGTKTSSMCTSKSKALVRLVKLKQGLTWKNQAFNKRKPEMQAVQRGRNARKLESNKQAEKMTKALKNSFDSNGVTWGLHPITQQPACIGIDRSVIATHQKCETVAWKIARNGHLGGVGWSSTWVNFHSSWTRRKYTLYCVYNPNSSSI